MSFRPSERIERAEESLAVKGKGSLDSLRSLGMTIRLLSFLLCFFFIVTAAGCGSKSFRRISVHRKYSRSELVLRGQSHKKPPAAHKGMFIWPLDDFTFMSPFGIRRGRRHDGVDLAARSGTPVKAAADGRVVFSGRMRGYGNLVLVKHNYEYFTAYAHNRRNLKKKGAHVKQGEVVAQVGRTGRATGNHVHFEIRKGQRAMDPLDFLPARAGVLVKKKSRTKSAAVVAKKKTPTKRTRLASAKRHTAHKTTVAKKKKMSSTKPVKQAPRMHEEYADGEVLPKEIRLPSSGGALLND